jgi:hypothetical protein
VRIRITDSKPKYKKQTEEDKFTRHFACCGYRYIRKAKRNNNRIYRHKQKQNLKEMRLDNDR